MAFFDFSTTLLKLFFIVCLKAFYSDTYFAINQVHANGIKNFLNNKVVTSYALPNGAIFLLTSRSPWLQMLIL